MSKASGWIGVDLDGTLAFYDGWHGPKHIGKPIEPMVARVKRWLAAGRDVRIFTARVGGTGDFVPSSKLRDNAAFVETQRRVIEDWCEEHIGQKLPITATKDYAMEQIWDDRAVQVVPNTGQPVADFAALLDYEQTEREIDKHHVGQ